jgi:hypothetical protein
MTPDDRMMCPPANEPQFFSKTEHVFKAEKGGEYILNE